MKEQTWKNNVFFLGETQKETQQFQFRVFFCTSGGCSYIYIYIIYLSINTHLYIYISITLLGELHPQNIGSGLDHWLCANSSVGFRCLSAFFDYECRLIGARSARLCPAADVMRYFRFGYPAKPRAVLWQWPWWGGSYGVFLGEPRPRPCKYPNKNGKKM